jgi:hypothetical protein
MNRFWMIITVVALIFPFAALGYKMATSETPVAALIYGAIVVVLAVTAIAARRVKSSS